VGALCPCSRACRSWGLQLQSHWTETTGMGVWKSQTSLLVSSVLPQYKEGVWAQGAGPGTVAVGAGPGIFCSLWCHRPGQLKAPSGLALQDH
jgi:hypothetical protein